MSPMIRRAAALTALAAVALGGTFAARGAPPSKSIAWQTDYKKALSLAADQHKIVMIDFYTEG